MKPEMSIDRPLLRLCWECGGPLDYDHFISANTREEFIDLDEMWKSPHIQILCCSCFSKAKSLMFLNSIQLEISSFIRTKIGNYIYAIQFGHVGEVDLRLEYKNTLPNRNEAFIITKGISDVEKKMREKYNYILIDIMEFLQVTNQFYDNRDFNAIKDIIMEDDNIIIEIGESLCPSIIYSTKHEYRAVFAPYLIELREELESYKEFYNANKEKLAIST